MGAGSNNSNNYRTAQDIQWKIFKTNLRRITIENLVYENIIRIQQSVQQIKSSRETIIIQPDVHI